MNLLQTKISVNSFLAGICGFLIAFPLFTTTRAYHTWGGMETWNKPIIAMLFLAFSLAFLFKKIGKKVTYATLVYAALYILFLLSTEVPFRYYDTAAYPLKYLIIISPLIFIFLDKEIIRKTYSVLYYIFLFLCILSLLNLVLYSLGLIKPSTKIFVDNAEFYASGFDIYPFGPVLANQYVDSFISFYRNNGWYFEPGHFAIHLALILALQAKPFSGYKNLIFVFTIITTLSGSGLAMLALLYIVHNYKNVGYQLILFIIIFILAFTYTVSNDLAEIIDKFVLEKFVGSDTLDNRRVFYGPSLFDIPTSNLLMGFGETYTDVHNWQLSDFTSHIYRYGLLSFLFYAATFFGLLSYALKKHYKIFAIILFFVLFVYAHRYFLAMRTEIFYLIWIGFVFSSQYKDFKSVSDENVAMPKQSKKHLINTNSEV